VSRTRGSGRGSASPDGPRVELTPWLAPAAEGMPDWGAGVLSEVTPEFVVPMDAAVGQSITVHLWTPGDAPVHAVELRRIRDGAHHRIAMTPGEPSDAAGSAPSRREAQRWSCRVEVDTPDPVHWHFIVQSGTGPYFYTQRGLSTVPPTEDHDFVFLPGGDVPEWPSGSVFYQVYPDRFALGDPSVGRSPGEYTFDGGSPRILPWDAPPLEFPEGRCQDFYNGDLPGIADRLHYLEDLGVTAIYVTPIFAARTTHRYDCIDYWSVDPALGGDAALAALTAEMHRRGMRLVVDVSINHTGSDHPWCNEHPEFYYRHDDGTVVTWHNVPTLPQLNYGNDELRRLIWEGPEALVRHWLRPPWEIDGWRFDVANQTARRGRDQFGPEVWRGVRRAVKATNPAAWIIGEHWEDTISYQLGDQWDGAMNYFACGSPLRRWAGELIRFEHDQPHYPPVAAAASGGRAFSGVELAQMVSQHYARLPGQIQHAQLNVLDTHDTHRFHLHEEVFDWEIYRGMILFQFLLPGAPNIWYGDEVGLPGHTRSVEGARYPMEWDASRWDARFRALYRRAARLKRSDPVLHSGAFRILAAGTEQLVAARVLPSKGRGLVLLLNKASREVTVTFRLPPSLLGGDGAAREIGAMRVREFREDLPDPSDDGGGAGYDEGGAPGDDTGGGWTPPGVSREGALWEVKLPPRRSRLLDVALPRHFA
jgi:alpha-glucosidase